MILHTQTPVVDETDGLPLPHRIWAVVGISFALCMSVLDINIINVVLPTLSHDFGTSPAVTTWIINGYQLAIVISLLSFSSLGEIYGYRKIFLSGIAMFIVTSLICALSHSFWTLTIARIFQGFSASAITSVNHAAAMIAMGYADVLLVGGMESYSTLCAEFSMNGSSRPLGSQRNSICRFLALAIRYQRPSRISCPDFGIKVPAPKRGTFKQTIRQAECHSQCNHLRTPDLHFGWICPPRKQ